MANQRLAEMETEYCTVNSPVVSKAELAEFQPQLPHWELVERDGVRQLERIFNFDDFAQALAFTQQVGELAEAAGHHPRLVTKWGQVKVNWWTTKINDLHRNDFILAARTDDLYRSRLPGKSEGPTLADPQLSFTTHK